MSKLDGIKTGDRVRVTFEGRMESSNYFVPDNMMNGWAIERAEAEADTFHIQKLALPIKVGDRVTWGSGVDAFEVVALKNDHAVLYSDEKYMRATVMRLSELRATQ